MMDDKILRDVQSINIGNMIYICKNKVFIRPLKIVLMTEEEYEKISREDIGEKDETKKEYILKLLDIINNNIDILIDEADCESYKKSFIEWLQEMKEDVAEVREEIVKM